jgi:hypothetical protein
MLPISNDAPSCTSSFARFTAGHRLRVITPSPTTISSTGSSARQLDMTLFFFGCSHIDECSSRNSFTEPCLDIHRGVILMS